VSQARAVGLPDGIHDPGLSAEQAIALALNAILPEANGFRLEHPYHTAAFTSNGLTFTPRHGGPQWQWRLAYAGSAGMVTPGIDLIATDPDNDVAGTIRYLHGGLTEQYLARPATVEQQFVIPLGAARQSAPRPGTYHGILGYQEDHIPSADGRLRSRDGR
jgi:hypothetical protein